MTCQKYAKILLQLILIVINFIQTRFMNNTDDIASQVRHLEEKYQQTKKSMYQLKLLSRLEIKDIEQFCNLMNIIAMKYSKIGRHETAVEWLRKAIKYIENVPKAKIITFNNLACVYRQEGNLPMALLYINKAQKQADQIAVISQHDGVQFEKGFKVVTDCSLNLCAILSSLKEHYKALKAVRKGLNLLEKSKQSHKIPSSYFISLYPIMKYNQGVELQQLKMYPTALQSYKSAIILANKQSEIYYKISKAIEDLQKTISLYKNSKMYESNHLSARSSLKSKYTIQVQSNQHKHILSSRNRIPGKSYLQVQFVKRAENKTLSKNSENLYAIKPQKNRLQINKKRSKSNFFSIQNKQREENIVLRDLNL